MYLNFKPVYMAKKEINKIRVIIPKNVREMLVLAGLINAKNTALGADSPLKILTWDVIGPTVPTALTLHNEAEALMRQAEEKFEQRDLLLAPIDDLVKQSRDTLKGVYRKEPRKLGEFGFTVNDTPR